MRILADLHIAPRTVSFLQTLGHDVERVTDVLPSTASDEAIVAQAIADRRTILSQDLDFSAIVALSGKTIPSVITLRLSISRIEYVNSVLERNLASIEADVAGGAIVTISDHRMRRRRLPLG